MHPKENIYGNHRVPEELVKRYLKAVDQELAERSQELAQQNFKELKKQHHARNQIDRRKG